MASYTFDTLSYAKDLIAAGIPQQQAEVISLRQRSLIENELATKTDIAGIQRDMKRMDVDLRRSIKKLETGLQRDVKSLGNQTDSTPWICCGHRPWRNDHTHQTAVAAQANQVSCGGRLCAKAR